MEVNIKNLKEKGEEVVKMKPIKLINLEDEEEAIKERILTEDDVYLLRQLKAGKMMEI